MALISTVTFLGTGTAYTGARSGRESISNPQGRASADRNLTAAARDIDRASVGETRVAKFLADEFGMSVEEILAEKRVLRTSWGNLAIAHTLAASDKQGMTVAQVLQLHDRGMGWGQIATGLRYNLDDAVRAVQVERYVAMGRARADGRMTQISGDGF